MKNSFLAALVFFVPCLPAMAQEKNYAVSTIPDSLLKHAHAVVRYYDASYIISGTDEYTVTEKIAITVLDEKGKKMGDLARYFGHGINTIESISGTLYDKDGKEIKSLKKKDILDQAAFGSFVTDYRVKAHSFQTQLYPYTTEYEVEERYSSTMNLQSWQPMPGHYCPTELSRLTIEYPASFPLRYHSIKLPVQPTILSDGTKKTLTLTVQGIKAIKENNEFATLKEKQLPIILLATDTFSLVDHPGSMATWKDFGRFIYQLNENRDQLSDELKKTVHQLADTCKNNEEKIIVLYEYLQKNTRYVSIQLGIGGYQTFDALFVGEKKYGDCKALSNFMKAMLKEAGITAYGVLVRSGPGEYIGIDEKFPYSVFNHFILCVPQQSDTIWLECTSQTNPVGYLGSSTCNRKVLLLTPDGGKVIKTPNYDKDVNIKTRKATLSINDKDELTGKIDINCKGLFWDNEYHWVAQAVKTDADKYLNSVLGFSNYKITESSYKNNSTIGIPSIAEEIKVTASTEVTRSGNDLILSTGMFPLQSLSASKPDTVHKEFQINIAVCIIDTVVINLNGNYSLSSNPKETNLDYPYGSYRVHYSLISKNTLIKTSYYAVNAGIYPEEDFKNYKKFRNESAEASKSKVVLTRE